MKNNDNENAFIEVDGKVAEYIDSTEKQKQQKEFLKTAVISSLASVGIIGVLSFTANTTTVEKTNINHSQEKDADSDIHNPRYRGVYPIDVDYSDKTYVYMKSEVDNPESKEEVVFVSGDDISLVEYDKVHRYRLLGVRKTCDELSVWEKEVREVEMSSSGEVKELSDWIKTGEYTVDYKAHEDSLTERYVMIANYKDYNSYGKIR